MELKKTVPKRRFEVFNNEWNEQILGEAVEITMGQSPASVNYTDNPSDNILVQGNADLKDNKVVPRVWTTEVTKMAEKNDLILSVRAPVGDIGKTEYDVVLGRGVAGIKGNEFIYQLLTKMNRNKYWDNLSTGSTFESINSSDIKLANIYIPDIQEQQKIGQFFKHLDGMIALQQKKIDKTKALKSAYLAEMFPTEGERVPKRRFSGFTDDWEEWKLGEVSQITMGQSPSSQNYTDNPKDHILVQGNADIKNNRVLPRVWTTQITKTANKNDLIMSVRAPVGEIARTDFDIVLGRGVAGLKGNEFLFQLLMNMNDTGYWSNLSTGSTFDSINSQELNEANVLIPSKMEQEKIGQFFKKLDDMISNHKNKLEKLKATKQAYLNEMFV